MRTTIDLLKYERRARIYFAALAQSALGTGAAHIALLVIAYERFESAWAISLVLLADLVPAMLLGPIFGAAADRWSRRSCMVVADIARMAAFLGIVAVDSFTATVAFALLAGVGTGLFTPAALSSLPSLVEPSRLPAATSIYGAIADLGFIVGPALSAAALLFSGPETILWVNAATFAISAVVLSRLRFGAAPSQGETPGVGRRRSLLREARVGVVALAKMAGIRAVVLGSGAMLLVGGAFNVAELPLATDVLGAGEAGFGALATLYGTGFIVGSLAGSRGGDSPELKRWFLIGLALTGAGLVASGTAPNIAVAMLAFALAGLGNGLVLVYERLLIQTTVDDSLMARVFGVRDGLTAWAFAAAFVIGGALVEALGPRAVLIAAGAAGLIVWVATKVALRRTWRVAPSAGLAGGVRVLGHGAAGENRPNLVDGSGRRLAGLDHPSHSGDDSRVELGTGVIE
jgi:MFS family permease